MRPLHLSRAHQVAGALALALSSGLGFLPLFAGPGYEAALGAGVLLPGIVASATAIEVSEHRPSPRLGASRGALAGAAAIAIYAAINLLHGVRAGFCEPLPGLLELLLGPGIGAVLGGVWGALAGLIAERAQRRWRRVALAVALAWLGPLAGIGVSFWRFLSSPMVFAFDPFFGHFAGPLYDTIIEPLADLVTYRAGTLLTLSCVGLGVLLVERKAGGRVRLVEPLPKAALVLALLAGAGSFVHTALGPKLGHWSTTSTIKEALGRDLAGERCDVVYSRGILERDARVVARDCAAHLRQLERWFGSAGTPRITVFLFGSADEKGRLMGAASTYIAKPWRHEIYIQAAQYPHPVLGHELSHVVAGGFGRGPFRVAGPLGGIVPDPGRIEGFAVAAAPNENDDLTLQQWARAMRDLRLLPPLRSVFRLSFLGQNSSTAYTVAGAFVAWLRERHGAAVLRAWYAGGDLGELTGQPLDALERAWHAELATVAVSPAAMSAAKTRFDRPAIFGRRCPHVVDDLLDRANRRLGQHDPASAAELVQQALALDPEHYHGRLLLGQCAQRRGDLAGAARRFENVAADPKLTLLQRAMARQALADLEVLRGNYALAAEQYRGVAQTVISEDELRQLEVKQLVTDDQARPAVLALLFGDPELGRDFAEAAAELAEWSGKRPEQGLPEYLLGKNLYNGGRWPSAERHLDRSLARGLDSALVRREALRVRLLIACATADVATARTIYERWRNEPELSPADVAGMWRLVERCGVTSLRP